MVSRLDHNCFQLDQLVFGNGSSSRHHGAIDRELCFKTFSRLHALIKAMLSHTRASRDRAPINCFIHAWDLSASRAFISFCTVYVTSLSRCIVFKISVRLYSIITWLINSIFTSGKKQRTDIVRDNIHSLFHLSFITHTKVFISIFNM